jgi:hypothetical protein
MVVEPGGKSGDTLSKLGKHFYCDTSDYRRIFYANRDKLNDGDMIQVGWRLTVPAKSWEKLPGDGRSRVSELVDAGASTSTYLVLFNISLPAMCDEEDHDGG